MKTKILVALAITTLALVKSSFGLDAGSYNLVCFDTTNKDSFPTSTPVTVEKTSDDKPSITFSGASDSLSAQSIIETKDGGLIFQISSGNDCIFIYSGEFKGGVDPTSKHNIEGQYAFISPYGVIQVQGKFSLIKTK